MWSKTKNILKIYLAFYAFCAHVFYPFALILESDLSHYTLTGRALIVIVFIIDMAAVVFLAVGALASRVDLLQCSLLKLVAECLYYIFRLMTRICLKRHCSENEDSTNYIRALGMLKLRKDFYILIIIPILFLFFISKSYCIIGRLFHILLDINLETEKEAFNCS